MARVQLWLIIRGLRLAGGGDRRGIDLRRLRYRARLSDSLAVLRSAERASLPSNPAQFIANQRKRSPKQWRKNLSH